MEQLAVIDPERIPVVVGVGQLNDRPMDLVHGRNSLDLMEAALRLANEDGGGGWLADLDSLAVIDQISFPELGDLSGALAQRFGANPRYCTKTPSSTGDSPILLLNEAANRIGSGDIRIAAVVGGEGLRTAARRAAAAQGTDISEHNASRIAAARRAGPFRTGYGLIAAVDVYPLYENAGRAAYGQTLEQGQRESGEIWSRFSQIAASNPGAWIQKPASPEEIITPSPDNRPISFPYNKLMVANNSVNQGAGFIVTSLAEARRRGLPEDRIIYVGMGAAAREPDDPLGRDRYDRSASMAVSIRRALQLNAVAVDDLDYVELYSCFPCVPKMARRILGWPVEKPATVFGGLTFGGGPIGNYMSHAVVNMVRKLRQEGCLGLLFGNGGSATSNHTILLSSEPIATASFPQDFNFQAEADADRDVIPSLVEEWTGPGTIESYTVMFGRDGQPRQGVVIARTADGRRTLAKVPREDAAGIVFLTDGAREPVGSAGEIAAGEDGLQIWRHRPETSDAAMVAPLEARR